MSEIEYKAQAYDAIMTFFKRNDIRLSETQVDKVVGGRKHRERLVAENKLVDITKDSKAKNSPWRYSASEVYAHVRTYNK